MPPPPNVDQDDPREVVDRTPVRGFGCVLFWSLFLCGLAQAF
jgi:hypothetical protein